VVPEDGTTKIEDLLNEAYWSMVAYKFKPCDIVEVHAEDGSYFAELYVRARRQEFGRRWRCCAKSILEPAAGRDWQP
jgi:hypothetical protein